MTGFKDRLKDALSDFVEFDESAHPPTDAPPAPRTAPTPTAAPVTGAAALSDPEMVATLEHAVARSTAPGYSEFRVLYAAMDSVPDERLRYDVALKALRASHQLGPDAVLASIEDRINLLEGERSKFDEALAAETERSVNGTTRQINAIAETIAARQAEIRDLEAKQAKLAEAARTAQADLDKSRATFAAAFATVHSALDGERARIATHLTSGK